MSNFDPYQLRLANDRIAERLREASEARLVATVEPDTRHRPTIRRSIGHSMIRIGERLAAEPPLQSARSR
jgi:hypothetical protein